MNFLKQMIDDLDTIVVIGLPNSGKTTLVRDLDVTVIHTDEYLDISYKRKLKIIYEIEIEIVKVLLTDILNLRNCVIEGCLCYQLLRYGIRNGWEPDAVVLVEREARYPNRMDSDLETTLRSYKSMGPRAPLYEYLVVA